MTDALTFATYLAKETGMILLDYYRNKKTKAELKADYTVITEADLAADRLIRAAIQKTFPNDRILSEEENTFYDNAESPTWIIDPVDGTSNFSLGIHYWGVSIARIVNGQPDTGALYFPVFDELYAAQQGKGATLNGQKMETRYTKGQPAVFFTCCSRTYRQYDVQLRIKPRIMGSAAYNFCAIASGRSAVGFEASPKIWDIAASWLVLVEAGGSILPYEKNPFPLEPGSNYEKVKIPVLGAANPEILQTARAKITRK